MVGFTSVEDVQLDVLPVEFRTDHYHVQVEAGIDRSRLDLLRIFVLGVGGLLEGEFLLAGDESCYILEGDQITQCSLKW